MITRIQPPDWAEPKGYANGVVARGAMLFVGGQIGWNAQQQFETDDFVGQTRQTLQNIATVLKAGGAGPEHMVRMTWYIVDREEYAARLKEIGVVYREVMGRRKDGAFIPMEISVSELQLATGRMFTGVVRDISERKQAEQEYRQMSDRLRRETIR